MARKFSPMHRFLMDNGTVADRLLHQSVKISPSQSKDTGRAEENSGGKGRMTMSGKEAAALDKFMKDCTNEELLRDSLAGQHGMYGVSMVS